jgi:multidrug efflux pump subunit AcrA (membrane-fusion protein)
MAWPVGLFVAGALIVACSSVDDKPTPKPAAPPPAAAKAETTKASKTKAVEVQGVISAVGQRTITFQMERKGKIREEVVGVDEKTKIEKGGANVKLRDLQAADQAMINYEPDAYTPAIAIKVTGKGKIQKVGGGD